MRRAPHLALLASLLALSVFVSLVSACAAGLPPAQQGGAQLYHGQGCHRCHAGDGSGGWFGLGPDLRDKGAFWDEPSLARYLADPAAFAADDPRLGSREMPAFGHLDEPARRRLARHVLGLMRPADG